MKNRSTGRLGRLFNAVVPETAACSARGSQPLQNTTRFPIPTFGNDANGGRLGGFTLIELLVVVLIIGILAAVALPQYELAVMKTRYATLQPIVRAIADAQELYYLENGEYTLDFANLSIALPSGGTLSGTSAIYYPQFVCSLATTNAYCKGNRAEDPEYRQQYQHVPHEDRGQRFCVVTKTAENHSKSEKLCRSLGGELARSNEVWDYYLLP